MPESLVGIHRDLRDGDGIALHIASERDGVPGMHGQTGKFLIVDFVDAAVAYKHVLSATLYARLRALAVSHSLPAVLGC